MKCPGDPKEICGGFFKMNIYETGISSKKLIEDSSRKLIDLKLLRIEVRNLIQKYI